MLTTYLLDSALELLYNLLKNLLLLPWILKLIVDKVNDSIPLIHDLLSISMNVNISALKTPKPNRIELKTNILRCLNKSLIHILPSGV